MLSVLENADIGEWVSVDEEEIGKDAFVHPADLYISKSRSQKVLSRSSML